jgi:hypothetical protein
MMSGIANISIMLFLQLGHQAVNCTNGTINWRQIYGDDAFRLKTPIYPSDEDKLRKAKEVDIVALEKRAREWAKVLLLPLGGGYDWGDVSFTVMEIMGSACIWVGNQVYLNTGAHHGHGI